MNIRQIISIAALAVLGSVLTPAAASCTSGSCVLVWQDEFTGSAVDPLKWAFENGNGCQYGPNLCGWGNNELQWYRPENSVVANGELTITAEKVGNSYYSSRLRTKGLAEWTYGRFEMRAKLPTGQGIWPAFWMLPTNSPYGGWARSGEIDIMEIVGHQPDKIYGTIHYHDAWPDNWSNGDDITLSPPGTANNNFHEYAVEWEEDEMRWYIDGNLYHTVTWWDAVGYPFPAPFDVDFHLLLNMAVGGNWPGNPDGSTSFPQEYVIDYVRVYQELPVFDDMEHGNPGGNGWYDFFSEAGYSGNLTVSSSNLPPQDGGSISMDVSMSTGGTSGYKGGFGRNHAFEIPADMTEFRMWINPDAGQDFVLEINLQEDDNNDGQADEEFQYNCAISPSGPCAIAGGGWQLVTIPLTSFFDDNTILPGGNGVLDAVASTSGGNGELTDIVIAVINNLNSGFGIHFLTDYWMFYGAQDDTDSDGIFDAFDNCINAHNPGQEDIDSDGHGNMCDADVDNDCSVGFVDLNFFEAAFFGSSPFFDYDSDGSVGFSDLTIFENAFFASPGPSACGACPCP